MPRIILGADSPPLPTEKLVEALAEELRSTKGYPLPLIVERHVRGAGSRHVWVVWDRWSDLNEEERSAVIVRAYIQVEGAEAAENITIASGIRPQEAALFGIVPFVVQPIRLHDLERSDYRQARAREGRNTIIGETTRELRYPTQDEAEQAIQRLKQSDPQTEWTIRHDDDEEE